MLFRQRRPLQTRGAGVWRSRLAAVMAEEEREEELAATFRTAIRALHAAEDEATRGVSGAVGHPSINSTKKNRVRG